MSKIITIPTVRKIDGQEVTESLSFQVVDADEWFAEQTYIPKPLPTQQRLDTLFASVTRIRLLDNRISANTEPLLELSDAPAIATLHRHLAIVEHENEDSFFHCMCMGDETLELYNGSDLIATISLHHGESIRWDEWDWDAELVDGQGLLVWLAEQGVTSPLQRYQEGQRRADQSRQAALHWQQAMPACLLPFWEQMHDLDPGMAVFVPPPGKGESSQAQINAITGKLAPLLDALEIAYPEVNARILVLFSWYGSGTGKWSGFPTYESFAEKLLLTFSTEQLVTALLEHPLTPSQLAGSARFFAGRDYRNVRYNESQQIPLLLKQKLLAHTLESANEDNIKRAQLAFAD